MSENAPTPHYEAVASEHMSPDRSIGLGRSAVNLRLKEDTEPERITNAIQDVRYQLREALFDEEKHEKMNTIINTPLPEGLKRILGAEDAGEPGFDMVGLLIAKKDRKFVVSDDALANFVDWHNHKLAEKQAELDQYSERYKEEFKQAFQEAAEKGWVPASALQQLSKLDKTRLVVDDGFTTTLKGTLGYAKTDEYGDKTVVMDPDELQHDNPKELTFHEFIHVLAGSDSEVDTRSAENRALFRLFGKYGGRVVNEAYDEDLTLALLYGDIDMTDPDAPERQDKKIYQDYRHVLHVLCSAGTEQIDFRLFGAEHFRQPDLSIDIERAKTMHQLFGDPMPDVSDREPNPELVAALHRSFPFTDVIAEISAFESDNWDDAKAYAMQLRERAMAYKAENGGHDLK